MIYHSSTRFKFSEKLNRKYPLFLFKLITIVLQDATYRNFRNYTDNICTIRAFPKKKTSRREEKLLVRRLLPRLTKTPLFFWQSETDCGGDTLVGAILRQTDAMPLWKKCLPAVSAHRVQ